MSETGRDGPDTVRLSGSPLSPADYQAVVYHGAPVALADDARIRAHRRELERQLAAGAVIYAVNTGYGAEANREIAPEALGRIQLNTVRSHTVSVGEPVAAEIVRGMLLLKAQAYAQGLPGVRVELVERILCMLNGGIHPVVHARGSQSASGDLIPNAHVGLALAGEGLVRVGDRVVPAREAMPGPFDLAPKEGVTLTNDVSFATAIAFDVLRAAERLIDRCELVAAMTLQAIRGYPDAYDERLIAARPHPGAIASARHMRAMLAGSSLVRDPGRRHDPYSLRCLPQVHGAVRAALAYGRAAVEVEIRSVGDNPLVFAADGDVVSGGNFHGAPLSLPMDALCTAVATLAALSQRRTSHLVDPLPGSRLRRSSRACRTSSWASSWPTPRPRRWYQSVPYVRRRRRSPPSPWMSWKTTSPWRRLPRKRQPRLSPQRARSLPSSCCARPRRSITRAWPTPPPPSRSCTGRSANGCRS